MLPASVKVFLRNHRLALTLVGVVVSCGIIIPACGPEQVTVGTATDGTQLGFDYNGSAVISLFAGQTFSTTASLTDSHFARIAGGTITYSLDSGDEKYASINAQTGEVTAKVVQFDVQQVIHMLANAVVPKGYMTPTSASLRLVINTRVSSLSFFPLPSPFRVGDKTLARVNAVFEAGTPTTPPPTIAWKSSNTAILVVDAVGNLTAVAPTSASAVVTIEGSSEGRTTGPIAVTILPALSTTLTLFPNPVQLTIGGQVRLAPTFTNLPPGNGTVVWDSPDKSRVTIDALGGVTAVAQTLPNTPVRVTATYQNGSVTAIGTADITVLATTITLFPTTLVLTVGGQARLAPLITNAPSGTGFGLGNVIWDSPDKSRVTIDAQGGVTGVAPTLANSPVRVTATYQNGTVTAVAFADITILGPTLVLSPALLPLQVGGQARLAATVTNAPTGTGFGVGNIIWDSPDKSRVTIDAQGGVTGVAPTLPNTPVRVTAVYTNGQLSANGFADVTVTPAALVPVISFNATTVNVGVAAVFAPITATVANPIAGGVLVVRTLDPTIATFSQSTNSGTVASGSISGVGSGTTSLVATYTAGSVVATQSIPVTVPSAGNSRVARIIIEPREQQVTAPVGFTYRVRYLDASGAATTPETAAEGGLTRFFNSNNAVATVTQGRTDPKTAQVVSMAAGTTNVTVLYTKNGQQVAVDSTNLTVYAAGTAGHYGSLTISVGGDVRQVSIATPADSRVNFQVFVRDVNSVVLTTGVVGLNVYSSDPTALRVDAVAQNSSNPGYFFILTGLRVGTYTLTADIAGAQTSIPIVVTP